MTSSIGPFVTVAFVHHANQLLITDGYKDRRGVSDVVGSQESETGLRLVLELHRRYEVPLSLHISGTLLESIAWHCPEFLTELRRLAELNLLELVGSSYGQNMMRFFSHEHNLRQLNEQLQLYEGLLGWEPKRVRVFWVPERLWDTEALSPVLTDGRLSNGGYDCVIVDDRLFYSTEGNPSPRKLYDQSQSWNPVDFLPCRIRDGDGLRALPIANNLRQNIPPRTAEHFEKVRGQMHWLLEVNRHYGNDLVAIYADDMEKAAGVGWDQKGPAEYESILSWVSETPWLHAVKIGEWASRRTYTTERAIHTGTYFELANEFNAGEDYEKWYYDPAWAPYRAYYTWTENRVKELELHGANPPLIELAWKVLLSTAWQTAWHTPKTGAHGEPNSEGRPSAWVRAIASHCRLAAIIAEGAYWMNHKENGTYAQLNDLDRDGHPELVLKNDRLFAVISPRNGGRLVYLFSVSGPRGSLVVGNPVDDWNLLEELHEYMDVPPNHPGTFSDVGHEHHTFDPEIEAPEGSEVKVRLTDIHENRSEVRIQKTVTLKEGDRAIRCDYCLSESRGKFSTEFGLSPDYLRLLRNGNLGVRELTPRDELRGWANGDVEVWAKISGSSVLWDRPRQPRIGHGYVLRATSLNRWFTVWLGVDVPS